MLHHKHGFTLLEVLIALFIFTIVSIIMSKALQTVFRSQHQVEMSSTRFAELNLALTLMANDLDQIIDRPVNVNTIVENSVIGTNTILTFTHAGLSNPLGQETRSTLQRTRYLLQQNQLQRITWPALDQTPYTKSSTRIMLNDINHLEFEYLNKDNQFQYKWTDAELPRAIRVSFEIEGLGRMSQLFVIVGTKFAKSP